MTSASHIASRVVLAAATAAALVLGVTPSARATGDGPGAVVPERPTGDQTIERLTTKTRQQRQGRAAWTALRGAFTQKGREKADTGYYRRAQPAAQQHRA